MVDWFNKKSVIFYPAMEIFSQLTVQMGCNYFPIISRSSYSRAGKKAEGVKLFPLYFPRETLFPARTSCCIWAWYKYHATLTARGEMYKGGSRR